MSILTTPEQCVGIMQHDGFYRIERYRDSHLTPWCCDPFDVSHNIIEVDGKQRLTIDVAFQIPTGEFLFEWDFDSLLKLKSPLMLVDILLGNGVRVSPAPKATIAILEGIQRPDLINSWSKRDEH